MGLGVSTKKRGFYDNSFWVKIVCTPPSKNHKQKVGSSLSHRLLLWAPPQVERGGCMQGNGLEKEPWAHLPLPGLLSLLSDARRTDVSEAPMQDLQGVDEGSRVAVSHQKYDILNGSRFPHTCCGTLMFMCRRRGRSSKDGRLGSRVISEAEGTKGLWELAGFTHLSTLSPDACRDVFGGLKMPDTSPAE